MDRDLNARALYLPTSTQQQAQPKTSAVRQARTRPLLEELFVFLKACMLKQHYVEWELALSGKTSIVLSVSSEKLIGLGDLREGF